MWLDKLKAIKKEKGMTSKQIAESAHLSEQTVKNIFSGETGTPRIDTIRQIASALGTTLDKIFEESNGIVAGTSIEVLLEENDILKGTIAQMEERNKAIRDDIARLRRQNDELKDKIIAIHDYYMRKTNQ